MVRLSSSVFGSGRLPFCGPYPSLSLFLALPPLLFGLLQRSRSLFGHPVLGGLRGVGRGDRAVRCRPVRAQW